MPLFKATKNIEIVFYLNDKEKDQALDYFRTSAAGFDLWNPTSIIELTNENIPEELKNIVALSSNNRTCKQILDEESK